MKMNKAKLTVMFLACAAAIPAFAQNTTDSRCGTTNYDSGRDMYTITNPTPGTATQQCFITVVAKDSWTGGMPTMSSSELVEGNYEITVSGGGGGGGGGAGAVTEQNRVALGGGGQGGYSAIPSTSVRYLNPGVYRVTIGAGGQGGMPGASGEQMASSGVRGTDGGPTSLSNAYSNETVAGFSGAESWDGTYPLVALASYSGPQAPSGQRGAAGRTAPDGKVIADPGSPGGPGYVKLALKDPVPQAAPAPRSAETIAPAPAARRPARRDRN